MNAPGSDARLIQAGVPPLNTCGWLAPPSPWLGLACLSRRVVRGTRETYPTEWIECCFAADGRLGRGNYSTRGLILRTRLSSGHKWSEQTMSLR